MPEEIEYFSNKRTDRTYISKAITPSPIFESEDPSRPVRILSKVFDSDELHQFVKVKNEVVLRKTPGERQEVKVVFYEDTRDIQSITFQRFTIKNGNPHKECIGE